MFQHMKVDTPWMSLITHTLDNLIISLPKATYKISDHWFVESKIKFEKAIVPKEGNSF